MISLLLALLLSFWIGAMAILSVQNATAVSVKFFFIQSIQMPVGIVLALAVSGGLLATVLIGPLWQLTASGKPRRSRVAE